MDIQAFARGDAPWDCDPHDADISVNDTLLASMIPVAASATHPQKNRLRPIATPSSSMTRRWPGNDPRWAAHAAATAQVPHD
ncbi:hypothetical protein GJV26_16400 [Massilia dura]|uniref:Uncharacterized protein n=1 Tax=Pseudoduganella dura TaxID=321982 RepID=A0A6I3XI03_9BURK|nr:hypothetical protein [Pseudoduganella dura]MUI14023.1 hypothetical protein [Pseudoduganella dura]